MRLFISVIVALLFLASVSLAATPQTLSVQGKLTDTLNNPYTGTKNFIFRIYDSETGGSALYTEFWNATSQKVSLAFGGYFSVLLGTYAPLTLPFDRQYWLEMNVEGETLSPRTKLGSTPYAYRANITENLAANANASGNIDMKNSLVQNIGAAGTNFIAGGGLTLAGLLTAGSGIAMAGQSLTSALWLNASYLNVSSDGFIGRNLGIGIASPLSRLHILQPGSNTLLNASNGTVNAGLYAGTLSGGQAGASIGTNSNNQFRLFTNGADALTVDTNGNVGIGTTGPGAKLEVRGSVAGDFSALTLSNSDPTGNDFTTLNFYSSAYGTYSNIKHLLKSGTGTHSQLQFQTSNGGAAATALTIDDNGNVGIGTTSPANLLHIKGPAVQLKIDGSGSGSSAQFAMVDAQSNGKEWRLVAGQNNLGGLQIYQASNGIQVAEFSPTGGFALGSGYVSTNPGVGNMIIQGNVGIGTANPIGGNLNVVGNVNITGCLRYNGGTLGACV